MLVEKSMSFIEDQLNTYLKLKTKENTKRAELSPIVKQNGNLEISGNHVGITLVNIEEEVHGKTQGKPQAGNGPKNELVNPDIKINLYLLFSANFNEYDESLKAISHLVSFFQSRNVFERSRYPVLGPNIERLIFDLQSLSFEQLNHLWGMMGAKYMPSLLYKMRMLVISEGEVDQYSYPITGMHLKGTGVRQ